MIIIPGRAVDKDKLFAEKVMQSKHKFECLDCGKIVNLCNNFDSDILLIIEAAGHVAANPRHKMLEFDDLQ